MADPVIATIIAKNYLAQARCLASSFLEHHPAGRVYALVIDRFDGYFDPAQEPFTVVAAAELAVPHWSVMTRRYTVAELCTAVKPSFLRYLFETQGLSRLCYFDPDIYFYGPIDGLWQKLANHPMVLTPHLLAPVSEERLPNEFTILQSGIFNLGFLGVQWNQKTAEVLQWWSERLVHYAYNAPERMQHYDQKWADFFPSFLDNAHIDRSPGSNVAYWDLANRRVTRSAERYAVNGRPLTFWHFSGFNPQRPDIISKYQNRFTFTDLPELRPLFAEYASALLRQNFSVTNRWPVELTADSVSVPTAPSRKVRLTETLFQMSPLLYQRMTKFLAQRGLEEPLTYWLGKKNISRIRAGFVPAFRVKPELPVATDELGVNVVGFFDHIGGVGEVARQTVASLQALHFPTVAFPADVPWHRADLKTTTVRYAINLICANADTLPHVLSRLPVSLNNPRRTIGYWHWELPEFPRQWHDRFALVREVWVASTFVQQAIAAVSCVPVQVMGVPVGFPAASYTRQQLGLPERRHVFLFIFDEASYLERKNPFGAIAAYRQAFGTTNRNTQLIIKANNLTPFSAQAAQLRDELAAVGGQLITQTMTATQIASLLQQSNTYVSLHRSEGFGLTVAEAMAHGKPVIATNYGGTVDYVTNDNAFPVNFELVSLKRNHGPYQRGSVWAEPDLEHAAFLMKQVVARPSEAAARGRRAAADIEQKYSPAAFGRHAIARLSEHFALFSEQRPSRLVPPRVGQR